MTSNVSSIFSLGVNKNVERGSTATSSSEEGSAMDKLSSRQRALAAARFSSDIFVPTESRITDIRCATVEKVQDTFRDLQANLRKNLFVRTRIPLQEESKTLSFTGTTALPLGSPASQAGTKEVGGLANPTTSASSVTNASLGSLFTLPGASATSSQHSASTSSSSSSTSTPSPSSSLPSPSSSPRASVPFASSLSAKDETAIDSSEKGTGIAYRHYITDDEVVLLDIVRGSDGKTSAKGFVRGGPRDRIIWSGSEVRAAIVSCGGLCPGVNDVVEELFNCLFYNYGVDVIYGIKNGFTGFWNTEQQPWQVLTPRTVRGISGKGGSILGHCKGGFDVTKILNACDVYGVNQLYLIGGDGTHEGALRLHTMAQKRQMRISIGVVPKTIDNDLGIIDTSFGFNTAVQEAAKAIKSVYVESKCAPNGIGIVTLMGRHAGYIASHATLASREVDVCLIPEVPFQLHGESGLLSHISRVLQRQGFVVIVVAQGAGEPFVREFNDAAQAVANAAAAAATAAASSATTATASSASSASSSSSSGAATSMSMAAPVVVEPVGIGAVLRSQIGKYFKAEGIDTTIRYVDPGHMIRSVAASSADSIMCLSLAHNAVHAAMAGYTGFTSSLVNNRSVLLPISLITASSPSYLNPTGRTWERVLSLTQQPSWLRYDKLFPPKHIKNAKAGADAAKDKNKQPLPSKL